MASRSQRPPTRQSFSVYQLKVTLSDVVPAVWRRIHVPADVTLLQLHQILQRTMPWSNAHAYEFIVGNRRYGCTEREHRAEVLSDRSVTLAEIAPAVKRRFTYKYDMADSWEHEVIVEAIGPADPSFRYPVCLAGERACPPEDCGGWPRYDSLLEASGNPAHPDYEEMLWWLGREFDPEAFDLAKISQALAELAQPRKRESTTRSAHESPGGDGA